MIRKDREITNFEEIIAIVAKCDVCRIALNGNDGWPYILPLNFGYSVDGGILTLYFHSALVGKKHELIATDNRATFEMDCGHTLLSMPERGYCTMNYESVIGQGHIQYIDDEEEKIKALTLMTDRYHQTHFEYSHAALSRTSVYKLTVSAMTAKRKATRPK